MKKKIKLYLNVAPVILGLTGVSLGLTACGPKTEDNVIITDFEAALKNHSDKNLVTGEKDQLVAKNITPSNGQTYFTYKSSDETILSVDKDSGEVEALKEGDVTLTITEKNSGISKSIENVKVTEGDEEFSVFAPKGAPLLAVYDSVANKNGFEVAGKNTDVPMQLKAGNYKYIIFDSVSALKLTNGYTEGEKSIESTANYTYLGMLTAGNFHLVSRTLNREPQKGDKILTFMKDQSPDMAFKACYADLFNDGSTTISYAQTNENMPAYLKAGIFEGVEYDYFLIAEPALTSAKSSSDIKITFDLNLNEKVEEVTDGKFDYIPQAGLFVNNDYLKLKPNYVASYWKDVKNQMNNVYKPNIDAVAEAMNMVGDVTSQKTKYGFDINQVKALQGNGANKFGVANPDKEINVDDINDFLSTVNAGFQINKK